MNANQNSQAKAHPAAPMSTALVVLTLSTTLGIQAVTTDLYLPALPLLAANFGAAMGQAQYTLSALLLAFGVSQLVWGPMSDRYGRRPILLIGLSAYLVAAIACALATSMVQANGCVAASPARVSSACQNLRSNEALCATMGTLPTKRLASRITLSAAGAAATIALVMPVRLEIKAGIYRPAFIRL